MWNSKPVVAVFGSHKTPEDDEDYRRARLLGRMLARAGFVVCNGGYTGVMEASSRGASEMGGVSLGLTIAVFGDQGPNPFVTREIKSEALCERLANFVELSDAFVVFKGGVGTLAELFVIWNLMQTRALGPRPLIVVGQCWPKIIESLGENLEVRDKDLRLAHLVSTPEQAMEILKEHVRAKP
jgi:uncharacterized protein (TIGR00730 family)